MTTKRETMSQHTPGPWKVVRTRNGNDRMTMVGNGDYGAIATTAAHRPNDDENEANARLIAAAPMLLDELFAAETVIDQALTYAEAMREHGRGTTFTDTHGRLGDSVLAGIRAAIRAAKGEN